LLNCQLIVIFINKDTAGQERFKTITSSFYRSTDGVVLVYSTTDESSFQNIRLWMEEVNLYATAQVLLVGTKSDLTASRVVTTEQGKDLATHYGESFFSLSPPTSS